MRLHRTGAESYGRSTLLYAGPFVLGWHRRQRDWHRRTWAGVELTIYTRSRNIGGWKTTPRLPLGRGRALFCYLHLSPGIVEVIPGVERT